MKLTYMASILLLIITISVAGCCCCTGSQITSTPTIQPITNTIGLSKENPAPLGTTVTYTPKDWASSLYGSTYSITLEDVTKGENANDNMLEKNSFEKPTSTTDDFLLAKFKITILSSTISGESFKIYNYDFRATSHDGGRVFENNYWTYDPSIDGELYSGGTVEGWVCLEAAQDEQHPLIVFDRDYNGKDGVWFSTG